MKSCFTFILIIFILQSCKKEPVPNPLASVTTSEVSIKYTIKGILAIGGGNITSDGGNVVTFRGVVWSTSAHPTISLSTKTVDGAGVGTFTSSLTTLLPGTTYYVRAYATTSAGTSYGNEISIITASIDLGKNILAYYPFSGNALDSTGNGNNGTVTGALMTTDRKGMANAAYSFSTTAAVFGSIKDQIYVPYNPSFNVSTITVALWVNLSAYYWTGNSNDPRTVLINRFEGGYSNPNSQAWGIQLDSTKLTAFILQASSVNAQNSAVVNSPSAIPLNTWTHVAFSYDNSNLKLYINGKLVSATPTSLPLNTNSTSGISMGQSRQANGDWNDLSGKLDEVGIWARALNAEEIKALAEN